MSAQGIPFVIEEADIQLLVDSNRQKVWLGGCAQNLVLTDEFTEAVLQRPGRKFGQVKHVDEQHTIEIESVWLLNDDALQEPAMPRIERGQVYRLIITWTDEDTHETNRRTYLGVTGRAQRVGANAFQNLTFRAEQMFENADPDAVESIDGQFREQIYSYNELTQQFTATSADVPTYAELRKSSNKVEVYIGGVLCAQFDVNGLTCRGLRAAGYTSIRHSPRLEFRLASRVFTVTAQGEVIAGNVFEDDARRDSESGMVFGTETGLTVSGAALAAVNGDYDQAGFYANKPFFVKHGTTGPVFDHDSIYFSGDEWRMTDAAGATVYESLDSPDFAQDAEWVESPGNNAGGDAPTVEVTSGGRYAVVNGTGLFATEVSEMLV
jgi:hypothetical protein